MRHTHVDKTSKLGDRAEWISIAFCIQQAYLHDELWYVDYSAPKKQTHHLYKWNDESSEILVTKQINLNMMITQ